MSTFAHSLVDFAQAISHMCAYLCNC